jgi:hypothetical protein
MTSLFLPFRARLLAVVLAAAAIPLSATHAADLTITWPPDAEGSYLLLETGKPMQGKPVQTSGAYPVEDGHGYRLVGTGFDVNFTVNNGKVRFLQQGATNGATGIRFDAATNTFSFVTLKLQLDIKDCDVNVILGGVPPKAPGAAPAGPQVYNLVYGHQTLAFGGVRLGFTFDAKGQIIFQDSSAGISVNGSTITVQGVPLLVSTKATNWGVHGTSKMHVSGDSPLFLLPGANAGYIFQGGNANVPFFVNNDGMLSLDASGPYAEVISIKDSTGSEVAKMMIPGGDAKQAARLAKAGVDTAQRDKVLAASASAAWKQDFTLVDSMKIYDYPEEQLNYPVEIPANVPAAGLKLLAFTPTQVQVIPFQLSPGENGGTTLSFRTELPQGETRIFRLVSGFDTSGIAEVTMKAPLFTSGPEESLLTNDRLMVSVPAGHQEFAGGEPLDKASAPILGLARTAQPKPWMAVGSFAAPETLLVDSIDTNVLQSGPVFLTYQISYKLQGGKSYVVTLELRANEPQVRIAEALQGFTSEDGAFLKINYGKDMLDPDQRLAGSGSGYDLYSGDYDRDIKEGKLNYAMGLFAPNGLGLMRSTAFYRRDGSDALMLSLNRIRDWKTEKRALWSSLSAFENLRFYDVDGRKYLTAGLSGSQRFWVMGLIPRDQVVLTVVPGDKALGAGPESRLFNSLTMWSLDAYKNRMPDWPEKLDAAPFDQPGFIDFQYDKPFVPLTFDEYKSKYMDKNTYFHDILNYSSNFGGYSDRAVPPYFAEYALNRAKWTPEQRAQIRQFLLLLADYVEGDDNQPHHSMLSGHPNFVMDTKQAIPYAAATFPNHPRAKAWRDSYMDFYHQWLAKYERDDVPELNTKGGRWTENIACYVGQCFIGLAPDQILLKHYDNTSLTESPRLAMLLRWMRDSFMSPNDGVRLIPSEGAHAFNLEPGHLGRTALFALCAAIREDDPQLSQEMHWIETNGKEGTKPDVRSGLFTDFGPVMHHDFAGPHESYAHLENLYGMGYRWSGAGVVYYAARNKVWSYNTAETNGDEYNINEISAFNVKGRGLTPTPTDQLLYDFGFAQFYREPGAEGDNYVARAIMLLRDDYLAVSDEVKGPEIPGTFNWASLYGVPQIYQLKPGAPMVEKVSHDPQPVHKGNPDRIAQVKSYSGKGDFLTIIAPDKVDASATPSGALVNGEHVFAAQSPETVTEGKASFSGTYGYARAGQLALFQGTSIGLEGFTLKRDGGDFGVSAAVDQNKITGRIVGRSGGKILITPPAGLDASRAAVSIDGKTVPATADQGAVVFSVDIAQKDGLKNYEIQFAK